MELICLYGDSLNREFFEKYNVSEKSDYYEIFEARYNYLCEVLENSSFFEEENPKGQEDEKCSFLWPEKNFVSEYGRIITGLVNNPSFSYPDPDDGTLETFIFTDSVEKLVGLVAKALGEYCGREIYSEVFFWDKSIYLLLADNQEEVDKLLDWVKKNYFEHKESMKQLNESEKAEEEQKKAEDKREKEQLKKQRRKDPEYKKKKRKGFLMLLIIIAFYLIIAFCYRNI